MSAPESPTHDTSVWRSPYQDIADDLQAKTDNLTRSINDFTNALQELEDIFTEYLQRQGVE